MAKVPTQRGVTISCLKTDYGATHFEAALTRWVAQYQNPHFTTKRQVQDATSNIHIPFNTVSVFNRIKFVSRDPFNLNPFAETTVDSIHVEPPKLDKTGNTIPGRFDTVLVNGDNGGRTGIKGQFLSFPVFSPKVYTPST